uniref:Uncharacterized protein n=1 Tax=Setaria viridis TaxID=4556 RepID=A0A4U6TVD1_SETVI|nr:hypothetical protein SEVIR_8G194900v2 [Setaria viridis]
MEIMKYKPNVLLHVFYISNFPHILCSMHGEKLFIMVFSHVSVFEHKSYVFVQRSRQNRLVKYPVNKTFFLRFVVELISQLYNFNLHFNSSRICPTYQYTCVKYLTV